MDLPKYVKVVEVGPRDGLQNEPRPIDTKIKIEIINRLSEAGLSVIEATSFVSEKWIPQLADGSDVLRGIIQQEDVNYPVLVPNAQGMQAALEAGAKCVSVFTAASETFSEKNTNCSINQSLDRIETIMSLAKQAQIPVRGYISCVLGCPYEGDISIEKVVEVAEALHQLGCYEISLGDTIGIGTPLQAQNMIEQVAALVPVEMLAAHFHDTYGQAMANLFACLQLGVNIIDSSIAGLGGCPYAPGAKGNVPTEDVIYMLNGMGIETNVSLDKLITVSEYIVEQLGYQPRAKVTLVKMAKEKLSKMQTVSPD